MTGEVSLIGSLFDGTVDYVWFLQMVAFIFSLAAGSKIAAPYLGPIGRLIDAIDPMMDDLQQALPALRKSFLWRATMTAKDLYLLVEGWTKAAERHKEGDPEGKQRLEEVKEKIRRVCGASKKKWTPEQEAAVEDIIHSAMANNGLIGSAVKEGTFLAGKLVKGAVASPEPASS